MSLRSKGRVVVFGLLLLVGGCAVKGRPYEQFPSFPEGKAVVTIYRPASLKGAAISYRVFDEGELTTIRNGGFYIYLREPGQVHLSASTEVEENLEFGVEAAKHYYVRATVRMGLLIGRPHLELVGETEALSELQDCAELRGSYHPGQ